MQASQTEHGGLSPHAAADKSVEQDASILSSQSTSYSLSSTLIDGLAAMSLTTYDVETPWYTPEWYAVVSEQWVQKCIAPKVLPAGSRADRRCKNFIDKEGDLAAVNRLQDEICASTDPYLIVRKMRELVLLRCCNRGKSGHRGKLSSDAETRRLIAELYIDEFTRLGLLKVSVPRNLMLNDAAAVEVLELCPLEADEVMDTVLRSRVDLSPKIPGGHKLPAEGYVYALSTPYTGVVKIGFSGRSGEIRQIEQEACLPGCRLIAQEWFEYPERIEQLIHLQLGSLRRKTMQCENHDCRRTHVEFFKLPDEEAKWVIKDWKELSDAEPLYDSDRYLTDAWRARLKFMTAEPTALSLMDVLAQEASEKEAAKVREEEEAKARAARVEEDRRLENVRQLRSRTMSTQSSRPEQYQTSNGYGRSSLPATSYSSQYPAQHRYGGSPPPTNAYSPPSDGSNSPPYSAALQRYEGSPPPSNAYSPPSTNAYSSQPTSGRQATVPRTAYSPAPLPQYPTQQTYGYGYGYTSPPPIGYTYPSQHPAPQQSYSYSSQPRYTSQPVGSYAPQPYQYSTYDLSSLADTLPSSGIPPARPRGVFSSIAHRFKNPQKRLTKQAA